MREAYFHAPLLVFFASDLDPPSGGSPSGFPLNQPGKGALTKQHAVFFWDSNQCNSQLLRNAEATRRPSLAPASGLLGFPVFLPGRRDVFVFKGGGFVKMTTLPWRRWVCRLLIGTTPACFLTPVRLRWITPPNRYLRKKIRNP